MAQPFDLDFFERIVQLGKTIY